MLSEFTDFQFPPGPAANSVYPIRPHVVTERFREKCRERLDEKAAETRRRVQPEKSEGTVSKPDPVISAIEEWHFARHTYWTHRIEVVQRWNTMPEWVRNWRGVYAGRTEGDDGITVSILARNEETLRDWYDRRIRESSSPGAARRLERRRREALSQLRLALAAEKGAYCAAGLPFEPDNEHEYWQEFRTRIERANAAVESTPARTKRGIEARCRHALQLIDEMPNREADDDGMRHLRGVIMRIARDVADISVD